MPEEKKFGPDISFNGEFTEYWAEINAADSSGVAVRGLRAGDELRILDISRDCAFSAGGSAQAAQVKGLIGTAADAVDSPWKIALDGLLQAIPLLNGKKRRDGYGQESGKTDFAIDEGGVLFCLPGSGGAPMSNSGNRPIIKVVNGHRGRVAPSAKPDLYFPIRGLQGPITCRNDGDGILRIVPFDHNHGDNEGVYEVVFTITRPGA